MSSPSSFGNAPMQQRAADERGWFLTAWLRWFSSLVPSTVNAGDVLSILTDKSTAWGPPLLSATVGTTVINSAAAYTVLSTDNTIRNSFAGVTTLTLPAVASSNGRRLRAVVLTANTVVSATANVVPRAGGAASTAILAAGAGNWADLECDGISWLLTAGTP